MNIWTTVFTVCFQRTGIPMRSLCSKVIPQYFFLFSLDSPLTHFIWIGLLVHWCARIQAVCRTLFGCSGLRHWLAWNRCINLPGCIRSSPHWPPLRQNEVAPGDRWAQCRCRPRCRSLHRWMSPGRTRFGTTCWHVFLRDRRKVEWGLGMTGGRWPSGWRAGLESRKFCSGYWILCSSSFKILDHTLYHTANLYPASWMS